MTQATPVNVSSLEPGSTGMSCVLPHRAEVSNGSSTPMRV
eukprot:CAMPEP_0205853276 /NCGR_PEP_ID=MMETSP1083-20121108/1465_1 /ASSEMBLY_ACC=CAM_ASM_000430 /TAXON_ID=97485 /ORGANISM="Prymnesium parvum, Strain Texoma1" /LENGTH=39 /DNA_ID= /DNA_START= /DNA_END= /DNA_ORIENTATION=